MRFKQFVEYVDSDVEYTDEQLLEIFGAFKGFFGDREEQSKKALEKVKKEREALKNQLAKKMGSHKAAQAHKAALDKALKDFGSGKRPGTMSDDDLEVVLTPNDRRILARMDSYEKSRRS